MVIPDDDPHRTRASRNGTTFNRWLKKAIVNGTIGASTRPVAVPKINKLVTDKPIIHTKTSQATASENAADHTRVKQIFTGT